MDSSDLSVYCTRFNGQLRAVQYVVLLFRDSGLLYSVHVYMCVGLATVCCDSSWRAGPRAAKSWCLASWEVSVPRAWSSPTVWWSTAVTPSMTTWIQLSDTFCSARVSFSCLSHMLANSPWVSFQVESISFSLREKNLRVKKQLCFILDYMMPGQRFKLKKTNKQNRPLCSILNY